MKILSISLSRGILEKDGAVQKRLLEQAALVDEMHVILYTPKGFDSMVVENLHIYPTNSLSKLTFVWDAVRIAKKLIQDGLKFDLCTTQDPFETALVGVKLKKKFGIKLHNQIHNDVFRTSYWRSESLLNRVRWFMGRRNLKWANRIRTVNKKCADGLVADFGIDARRIDTFPIPTDVSHFANASVNPEFAKRFEGKHVVLTACRLSVEKNLSMLIRAFKDFSSQKENAVLVIVGEGSEKEKLQRLAASLGISEKVYFEGWSKDLASYYKIADVFVLCSNHEGFARTVVEANASGCPVIMTDVGLAGEWFIDGEHGRVIPVNNNDALSAALLSNIPNKAMSFSTPLELYEKSWDEAVQPAVCMVTQIIDPKDPILGFSYEWLKMFQQQTPLFSTIGLQVSSHIDPDFPVYSLEKEKNASKFRSVLLFYRHCISQRNSYDSLFVHMNPFWAFAFIPLSLLLRKKILLWYVHPHANPLLHICLPFIDSVFSCTQDSFPLSIDKCIAIGHGIPTQLISTRDATRPLTQIALIGRVTPVKQFEIALEAIAASNKAFEVTVIGPISDPTYKETLHTIAQDTNLALHFSGALSHSELLSQLPKYDICINTTVSGSFDKVLLEAAAANLCVLTSNTAYRSIFPDEVFFKNQEELSNILVKLYDTQKNFEYREVIEKKCSLSNVVANIISRS